MLAPTYSQSEQTEVASRILTASKGCEVVRMLAGLSRYFEWL